MKDIVKRLFHFFGFEISKLKRISNVPKKDYRLTESTMEAALFRLQKKVNPSVIIDLGAAAGTWSLKANHFFPESTFVLFEPLNERKAELNDLASVHKNFIPVFAAAGSAPGTIRFSVSNDLDGSGVYDEENGGINREVEQVTMDQTVEKLKLSGPFLLKFDTHGFEIPILEGAKNTLKSTEAIIMECYGFKLTQSSLLIHEMVTYMTAIDFRLADIVDIMRRPSDEMFWQCDLVFLKKEHSFFNNNVYA